MPRTASLALIRRYYDAFNAGDAAAMLACLTGDIEHRVNESGHRIGKDKFAEFCGHMGVSYREQLKGQTYTLPAGGFFDIRDGLISRITTFYNLNDWVAQVSR